jgi:hypothetical protein
VAEPIVEFRLDPDAVRRWLTRPDGDVARYLFRKGLDVSNVAKQLVGVDEGELRRDIGLRPGQDSRGLFVDIGSSVEHALVHHEGSAPHTITTKPPGRPSRAGRAGAGRLSFTVGGRKVFARIIHHPGTRGTHYLTRALEAIRR